VRVLNDREVDFRGLGTKAKKLDRLIEFLKGEDDIQDPGSGAPRAPAPAAPAPARRRRQPPSRKRALSTPPSTDEDEDGSSSDSDVDLALRARLRSQRPAPRNRQVRKQPKKAVSTPPRSSVGTDGDDEESSDDDLEESLADRKKRVMEEKEALPDDYTFEDMTPGSLQPPSLEERRRTSVGSPFNFPTVVPLSQSISLKWWHVMLQRRRLPGSSGYQQSDKETLRLWKTSVFLELSCGVPTNSA
jgi:hypothetical protein